MRLFCAHSQGNAGIRSMAIRHFGELLKEMSHYTWMLNHVVLGGLVPLILFLEDTEIRVVKVSPVTLFFLLLQRNAVFSVNSRRRGHHGPFSLSQACKYTLAICASELKWPTSCLFDDQNYSFELVVLNICNNLVSGPSEFTAVSYRQSIKGHPE